MVTDRQPGEAGKKSNSTKIALQLIGGGAFGFFFMLGLDYVIGLEGLFDKLSITQFIALTLSMIYILIALIVLAMSGNRKIFMLNHRNEETSEREFKEIKPMLFWSSICLILYAAALAFMALASLASSAQQLLYFWGVVAAMLAQTAISVHLWNRYDELYRGVTKESCAAAFVISEMVLFIWAAAAICGLEVTFEPLAVIIVLTGIYWAASIWFISRRGLT